MSQIPESYFSISTITVLQVMHKKECIQLKRKHVYIQKVCCLKNKTKQNKQVFTGNERENNRETKHV